jgi:cardiolipin synthase
MGSVFEHPEGTSVGELEIDKIWTVPNLITTARLLCIPWFVYLLLPEQKHYWQAAVLLGVLGATDWIDGYVARRFNQTSNFGKMYDPTVDRIMLIVAVIAIFIVVPDPAFRIYAGIIVIREVAVSIWVVSITAMGAKRMNVTWWGKVGTFLNMVAFPAFLGSQDLTLSQGFRDALLVLAWVTAIPGLGFNLAAAWQYVGLGRQALAEGRADKAAAAQP